MGKKKIEKSPEREKKIRANKLEKIALIEDSIREKRKKVKKESKEKTKKEMQINLKPLYLSLSDQNISDCENLEEYENRQMEKINKINKNMSEKIANNPEREKKI